MRLSTTTTTPDSTFSRWRLCRYTRSCVRCEPSRLLWRPPGWCSGEDDRQVATHPQHGSMNRLEHMQVWQGTRSFPAKSATLAGCCRPSSVQSLRPSVRCLHKIAPEYLSTYCQPVSGISGRHHLQSADRGHLDFPRVKLASYGRRLFSYAGPSNCNPLPAYLRDSSLSLYLLSTTSKPFFSLSTMLAHTVHLGFFHKNALYKFTVIIIIIIIIILD